MTQQNALVETFVVESDELLAQLENGLLSLEKSPEDVRVLNAIFRVGHTFKGSAGLLELGELVAFTHVFENVLDRLRKCELKATRAIVSLLLSSRDVLQEMVKVVAAGGQPGETALSREIASELRSLATVQERAAAPSAAAQATSAAVACPPAQRRTYRIDFKLAPDTLARGQDPAMLLLELGDLGELMRVEARAEGLPPWDALDPENLYLAWTVVLSSEAPPSKLEDVFVFVREAGRVRIRQVMRCDHFV